ncbi:Scarecrow-like protein 15 [Striga hermonthica]|uniref:Scarecrow-like protein 15 n=1 Tax=Striga hermonthica TaxID=68872 RepID=A0A9N7NZS0_STRHE|nr:Scarecrow-like protein 15 [Striga hermonthica]
MKVPFPANTQNPKPLTSTITATTTTAAAAATYEPKSVLDLRRSPSPVSEKPAPEIVPDPLADHALINQQIDDWDSLMRELGLHDDSAPLTKPVTHSDAQLDLTQYSTHTDLPPPPVVNPLDSAQFVPAVDPLGLLPDISTYTVGAINSLEEDYVGYDYVDELIRLAECFDTNSVQLGHVILARLNQRLISPTGKPLQRAAFYFKEALQSLVTGSTRAAQPANSSEIVQTIKAQKTFSAVSPIPLFSGFTANQAVLEALDGSNSIHVIDFEIGLGAHWASFMKEVAERPGSGRATRVRVSAVVPDEYVNEPRLIRDNLTQFARELSIRFEIEFVSIGTFEYLSLKAVNKVADGERVAVLLSPAVFRRVGTRFLGDLRGIAGHVVVHVGVEGNVESGTGSHRQAVIDGLELYSTVLESLEATNLDGEWMRRIERCVVYPRILEAAGRRGTWWREALLAVGLRQVGPSQFAEFQAECLLRRAQVRGFHVARRQAEMLLCWHDRPILATSSWRY